MSIYLISGKIASGKTTISIALSECLGIKRFTVSDYLKYCANLQYGGNYNRNTLQKIGDLKRQEGYEKFCTDFLNYINYEQEDSIIIDGIRTTEFLKVIKKYLINKNVIHVFIDIDEKIRYERLIARNSQDQLFENHSTETASNELMRLADIIINSNESVENILNNIIRRTKEMESHKNHLK